MLLSSPRRGWRLDPILEESLFIRVKDIIYITIAANALNAGFSCLAAILPQPRLIPTRLRLPVRRILREPKPVTAEKSIAPFNLLLSNVAGINYRFTPQLFLDPLQKGARRGVRGSNAVRRPFPIEREQSIFVRLRRGKKKVGFGLAVAVKEMISAPLEPEIDECLPAMLI